MDVGRRRFTQLSATLVGTVALAPAAFAQSGADAAEVTDAIMAFTGGVEPTAGGVTLTAPEIAENGNNVPIDVVGGDDAVEIAVFASANPLPGVATFKFSSMAADRRAMTRIRLAQTQDVIAVVKNADGSFGMDRREVKVTIGGCGG